MKTFQNQIRRKVFFSQQSSFSNFDFARKSGA
jgi:hypothetical protein